MPVVSTPFLVSTCSCSGRKSSPTTPTTRTSVKKLAERAKCVAAPPRTRSRLPLGVSSESNATEPTTRIDMNSPELFDNRCCHNHRKTQRQRNAKTQIGFMPANQRVPHAHQQPRKRKRSRQAQRDQRILPGNGVNGIVSNESQHQACRGGRAHQGYSEENEDTFPAQHAYQYFPKRRSSFDLVSAGIIARSVMMAYFAAVCAGEALRSAGINRTAALTTFCALPLFWCMTAITCSTVTSSW